MSGKEVAASWCKNVNLGFCFHLSRCKAYTSSTDIVVVRDSILLAPSLIDKLKEHFRPMMTEKAKQLPPSALLELQGKDKGKAAASSAATASNSK